MANKIYWEEDGKMLSNKGLALLETAVNNFVHSKRPSPEFIISGLTHYNLGRMTEYLEKSGLYQLRSRLETNILGDMSLHTYKIIISKKDET